MYASFSFYSNFKILARVLWHIISVFYLALQFYGVCSVQAIVFRKIFYCQL